MVLAGSHRVDAVSGLFGEQVVLSARPPVWRSSKANFPLDTKVGDLFPEASPPEKREVTVRQLLSMTSGVIKNDKFRDEPDQFAYALNSAPMTDKPGTKWDYNNTGLAILSPLFAKATGREIDEYLESKLFEPIGVTKSDWTWERSAGHALPYSGLHINARALGRFGLLFLNHGKWQDRQIVPSPWVAEATHSSQQLNKQYGFLWWANTDGSKWKGAPADAFAALGRFDNNLLIFPSHDMIVIRQIGDAGTNVPKFDQAEWAQLALGGRSPTSDSLVRGIVRRTSCSFTGELTPNSPSSPKACCAARVQHGCYATKTSPDRIPGSRGCLCWRERTALAGLAQTVATHGVTHAARGCFFSPADRFQHSAFT